MRKHDPTRPKEFRLVHVGHWHFAAGPHHDFRFTLETRNRAGRLMRLRPIGRFATAGIEVRLYRKSKRIYDIDRGHVFALWRFGDRTYGDLNSLARATASHGGCRTNPRRGR